MRQLLLNNFNPLPRNAQIRSLALCPSLARISSLWLRQAWMDAKAAFLLAESTYLSNLKSLQIQQNSQIGGAGVAALLASAHLPCLWRLWVDFNGIDNAGAAAMAAVPGLQRLTDLNMNCNDIGVEGITALAASPYLANLRQLRVANSQNPQNKITDQGVAALAASPYLTRLQILDLSSQDIGPQGAAALAAAPHLQQLTTLILSNNHLGDAGAQVLAEANRMPNLKVLALSWNEVGNVGASAFAAALQTARLETLDLSFNLLSDVGASARPIAPPGQDRLSQSVLELGHRRDWQKEPAISVRKAGGPSLTATDNRGDSVHGSKPSEDG